MIHRHTIQRALVTCFILLVLSACSTETPTLPALTTPIKEPDANQRIFTTPENAVEALVKATQENNKSMLVSILGTKAGLLLYSGDRIADQLNRSRFLAAYDKAHKIDNAEDGKDVLIVGDEEWPMPIPLVYSSKGWWFDTSSGEQEILNRRIGHNELNAIAICHEYVDAQREFAALSSPKQTSHEYAQRFQSSGKKHNGLYWHSASGDVPSPLRSLIAEASAEGYSHKPLSTHRPFQGYYYKILKQQGSHAPGGAQTYILNGRMTEGYALIAFPARYGDSGVMTFIVNQDGIIYEKNLGTDTLDQVKDIVEFDPDDSWNIVRE